MIIKKFTCGALKANGYVVHTKNSNQCYVIDPGYNGHFYVDYAKKNKLKIEGVLLTHHHFDHSLAAPKIAEKAGCKIYVHKNDEAMLRDKLGMDCPFIEAFDDDRVFTFGNVIFKVKNTKGHTKGGVCYIDEAGGKVFTGDTVFADCIGITHLEDGSSDEMVASCKEISSWPGNWVIYPGHGPKATIDVMNQINEELKYALTL